MTVTINIAEAKAKLSSLIEAALTGEEVVISRAGKPVVKLTPVNSKPKRRLGILKDYGWTGPATPYEAFGPEPEFTNWIDEPLLSDK